MSAEGPGAPAVISTGGGNSGRWLEREAVRAQVRDADRVVIWREREKDAKTQAVMDRAHARQLERIERVRGHLNGVESRLPERGKDLGEAAEMKAHRERAKSQSVEIGA